MTNIFSIPITETVFIEEFQGDSYIRTKDLAGLLKIKQQYEFTSHIKKTLGEFAIKKGAQTLPFRSENDCSRTTFLSIPDAINYLELVIHRPYKYNTYQLQNVLFELKKYITKQK